MKMEMENKNDTMTKLKRKDLGFSCMLNTEIGAVLAVIRRAPDLQNPYFLPNQEESYDSAVLQSLRSLRSLIFNPQQEWRTIDPSMYLCPFLDVIQSDDIPAPATGVAILSVLKILKLDVFDEKTPGAKEAINLIVTAITSCRLERTTPIAEEGIMMRVLQVLVAVIKNRASVLLTDHAICTIVNTSFQLVQQSSTRGDLLQRNARYTMHELVQTIFAYVPDIEVKDGEDMVTEEINSESGFSIQSAVDIFQFLCSLLNVVEVVDTEGQNAQTGDDDVQIFALGLINSALEQSGDSIGKHPKLLKLVQDDLCQHLIHYGTCSSPLVLSMICSTFLNIYHFLRRFVRLQLEAFFSFVLFRVVNIAHYIHLQEVAIEGIINFCRQPSFIIEAYVNYDCDPIFRNVFEDIGKILCKNAFPNGGPLSSLQIQAFEGLVVIIHNIADNIDKENDSTPSGPYPVEISEFRPFWEEKSKDEMDLDAWVDFLRIRKMQKRRILIAANHYNRDEKKGLEYLKISKLISKDDPDPKGYAIFFRHTIGLDKTMIGDYLGDPDDFHQRVLKEFVNTFDFSGMVLDVALRKFLETFRLPGESQKIERILEVFSEKFYNQQSSDVFANQDAVHVLCYSLIMLNTDQHNHQVKKKMTEAEFIKNNRAINKGNDLPREYLSELFQSISSNAITLNGLSGIVREMNPNSWVELTNRSKNMNPFILCSFDRRLGRDMFSNIAGPSVATLSSIFEQTDEEELLHECIEGLFSIAKIAQYGLEDILDEILASFCKFTTLLNPYVSSDETLYAFSHDMKPRLATLAVFTIANILGESIRAGWRNIVDCLLKLRRLMLLPQSIIEADNSLDSTDNPESELLGLKTNRISTGLVGRFSQFLSMETVEENLNLGLSEFDQNMKMIQHCQIGRVFRNSSKLPEESLLNLGRSLIFSAAGKGQKFSTPIEEEETVGFCWELILLISVANVHRFMTFWPQYHDFLLGVSQFPLFSPVPFAEKGLTVLVKVCLKLVSTYNPDKHPEELIFKSINLMWRLDKEVIETCAAFLTQSINTIITKYPGNLHSTVGWKTILHLLSLIGRHPDTYELGAETLITLMADGNNVTRSNFASCIDCAFSFVALKNTPLETNIKIMDLMSDSVKSLIQWYKSSYSDPGSSTSIASGSSVDDMKSLNSSNYIVSLFIRLGESLRKTSLARREEIRNHAIVSLQKCFSLAEELYFTPTNCINCFNLVVFAMVDDLHEKMLEYSRRENAEREMRSMEGTLKIAMELLTEVYLMFLRTISESSNFRTFWLGILRRMDTCMKAELGEYGTSSVQDIVPGLLRKMITTMQERGILVQREEEDLWEITYIQIQWIAPSLKEELFPDEV